MVFEFSNCIEHNSCNKLDNKLSDQEVKNIMLRLMQEKGVSTDQIAENGNGQIAFKGAPANKIHSLLLEAEKLGFSIKYTKKTLIEVC